MAFAIVPMAHPTRLRLPNRESANAECLSDHADNAITNVTAANIAEALDTSTLSYKMSYCRQSMHVRPLTRRAVRISPALSAPAGPGVLRG